MIEAIEDVFNSALGISLLYRFERPAYSEVLKKHVERKRGKKMKPSEIYGAEHLLRLLRLYLMEKIFHHILLLLEKYREIPRTSSIDESRLATKRESDARLSDRRYN